ncbi:MAG TPA: thioredoxin domain-containing protein [Polyangia bacterium]|nr:thioredoxin domain-containing protein [Polyangia bacterium]
MVRKIVIFALAAGVVVGGYYLGKGNWGARTVASGKHVCEKVGASANDDIERKCVPFEGMAKGSAKAQVTIVEFSDFQCPYCSRVVPTMERLVKEYPDKVRVFFKQNPLPFHDKAQLAAEAALAAGAQGKFWKMHDELFANQSALDRPALEKYAAKIGLNMGKFKAALDNHTFKAAVDKDLADAKELGVQGTPNFFINGRPMRGAVPYEQFKTVVDEEIARAKKLLDKGTSVSQLYAAFVTGKAKGMGVAAPPPRPPVSNEVYKVEVDKAPRKGGQAPKITLIEFSDFQCPFCSRAKNTLEELLKIYKDNLEISFKQFPLPFHNNAMPAAIAAVAADQQGKFWPMYDKLFANQQNLDAASLEKYAQEIGLDVAKFKAAIADPKTKAVVEADMKQASQFGVQGTPSFFVNGRAFSGAYPLESFQMVLDEELKKADAKLQAGTPRAELYAAIIKDGLDKKEMPKEQARPNEPSPTEIYKADVKGAPIKGAKDALVTIVQFSDFQCPYCSRVEPTIDKIMEEYKGKVRVAWRNKPLPFHDKAKPAAIAALAANQQGKFWEMHAIMFKNQQNLDAASLEKYAKEIGLDMAKFKAALQDKKLQDSVEADVAMGDKLGARGTPAFFVNGSFLSGAQPFENFKSRIDEQLKKAEELVKKGTPKLKVYDALMKTAKAEVGGGAAPAAAPAAAPEAGPVKDVDPGNSPSRGPKNAPLTVVLFSDFQCPFCGRVEPSLTELEKAYPGKVRVVWKNFPLSFHNNAKPAAEAAMAANEQGKFWEMHAKLFANQQNLDAASLEKYAKEIGLDVAKFKASVDSHKFAPQIEADTKQGSSLGVQGTPASFLNGHFINGAQPFDAFKKIADEEMAKGAAAKGKKKVAAAIK